MIHDLCCPSPVSRHLPQPKAATFLVCPLSTTPERWAWQAALYEWALHEARAVVGASLLERDLLAVWN